MKMKSRSLILILFEFAIKSVGFLLHGSADPVTAHPGGAVLLPCFVDRPLSLEELEVDWRRTDSNTIVHQFQGGQSRPESQGEAYRGRARFFSQEIPKGNFSLLLEGVRTADAGVYKCVVYTWQEWHETQVEIQEVEWLVVTGGDEPVYAHAGEDVTLSCSVDTHVNVTELQVIWMKPDDDIMVLLFADGENRPESQHERYSGRAEFFTEEIPKGNFSVKLRKVRTEDKGEYICHVHSDTDSANTTARIAALGYSSLHWLILVLCIAVTPVVLLTGVLSVRHTVRESISRQGLLSHWSLITIPVIMISSAFILWGVTEGSTEEAVTCTVISLLNILVLFNMDPNRLYPGISWKITFLTQRIGIVIIIIAVCTVPSIKISTKYFASTAGKVALGGFVGEYVAMVVFFASMQFYFFWFLDNYFSLSWTRLQERLKKMVWATFVFLIIMISVTIGVGVFLVKYVSETAGKAEIGTFLTIFLVPMIMFIIPFVGFGIFLVRYMRRPTGQFLRLYDVFESFNVIFIMLILTLYNQLIAWMQGTILWGYFIPVIITPLGVCACIIAKAFLRSFRLFYFAQKILLGFFFLLHLISSVLFLSMILKNDNGRPEMIFEYVFIYVLTVTSCFQFGHRQCFFVKLRKYVYFSGAFVLPLVNSVALTVVLKLKADTGKQSSDLRVIVLISGSVFVFIWFVIQISAYALAKKKKIKEACAHLQRLQDIELELGPSTDPKKPELSQRRLLLLQHAEECQQIKQNLRESWSCSRPHCHTMRKVLKHMTHCQAGMSCEVKHCASSQEIISHSENCAQHDCPVCRQVKKKSFRWSKHRSHDNTGASSPTDPKGLNTKEGLQDNEETKALSPTDLKGPNTEEGSHDNQELEASSPTANNDPNTEDLLLEEENTKV